MSTPSMRTEYARNADVNANIRDGQKENAFTADMNARMKILLTINARCADSSARTLLMKTAFVRFAERAVNIWNGKTGNAKNAKWSATTEITARQQESAMYAEQSSSTISQKASVSVG